MRDQLRGINLSGLNRLKQHRRTNGIDQPRGDRDIPCPQGFEMEVGLGTVDSDVGDDAAWRMISWQSFEVAGMPTASIAVLYAPASR